MKMAPSLGVMVGIKDSTCDEWEERTCCPEGEAVPLCREKREKKMGGAIEHSTLFSRFSYTEGNTTRSAVNFGIGIVDLSAKKDASTAHLIFREPEFPLGLYKKRLIPDLGCYSNRRCLLPTVQNSSYQTLIVS